MSYPINQLIKITVLGKIEGFPQQIDFENGFVMIDGQQYPFSQCLFSKCSYLTDINNALIFEHDSVYFDGLTGIVVFEFGNFLVEVIQEDLTSVFFKLSDVFYNLRIIKNNNVRDV